MDIELQNKTISCKQGNNHIKKTNENDDSKRPNWSNSVEFLMSCISVSVGLGNVWRFPFTAFENGGGAFLIPYIIVLIIIGKPMYYLEMILGQFTSKSSINIWAVCPAFVGVGIGQAYSTLLIITYYSSLLALNLYYFGVSFQSVLPWTYCRDEWGAICVPSNGTGNRSTHDEKHLQTSSELYFLKKVINEKDSIADGIGFPNINLTIALLVSWIVIFSVIAKGVKSSGKAAYFLALFPYFALFALLIRAVTLEGAMNGIIFFLKPNWAELLNPKVWKEAVVQCFFSLAVGLGSIVMFSSYNKFDHGIYRDAMIVTTLDTFTSILAGVTMFGVLGNLAHNLNIENISEVVRSGTGLAFISYPDAIAKFEFIPQIFAVSFFFMMFVLGVGSIVALQSSICTMICDRFVSFKFVYVAIVTCALGFLSSIVYATQGGQWILNLIDFYGGTFVVFVLAIFELIGITWIYGLQNFCDDVEFMTNKKVTLYWRLCWTILTPGIMLIIFIYSMITMESAKYSGMEYPELANIAGWLILSIGFAQFPLWFIWEASNNSGRNLYWKIKTVLRPSESWGPVDPEIRARWELFKLDKAEKRRKTNETNKISFFWQKINNLIGKNSY
ncbi:sodium-dependent nutrient amino acid transporter 1-like [Episyrphus balteatus]|uniref:sodium-dependent nutrient amino acid transporter 1-like n=1 Tax=Episyrphus balteatus TaxID=286459 RepID=UPI00248581B8|nr:sodium-dependent nutrient amino acid transporter 1-like [Episyrphus balteatus]